MYSLAFLAAFVLGGWYMSLYSSLFFFSFLCILHVDSRACVNIFLSLLVKKKKEKKKAKKKGGCEAMIFIESY